jgi:hypothetical protein
MRSELPISAKAKTLFLLYLAKSIAQTLNVTSGYVCRGTNIGDHGLWEARKQIQETFNETAFPKHRLGIWLLKTSIIRNYCISHPKGQFSTSVGDLICLGQKFCNDTAQETNSGELQTTQTPAPPTG